MPITPPSYESLSEYYQGYWKYLTEENLLKALSDQQIETDKWLYSLPENYGEIVYAEGKWMLKEVIGHLCDTERILTYRALRFARNDNTSLEGFNENNYVHWSGFRNRSLKEICWELNTVRESTISFFRSLSEDSLDRKGLANGLEVTPRILLYFIIVHQNHHIHIVKDRYLNSVLSS